MNEQIVKGKWQEIKGEIQKAWGNITGDELEKTKGDAKAISGLIQQKYGHQKEEISTKLTSIFDRFSDKVSDKMEQAKESLRDSNRKDYRN